MISNAPSNECSSATQINFASVISSSCDFSLWHRKLGHPGKHVVNKILNQCNVQCKDTALEFCEACSFASSPFFVRDSREGNAPPSRLRASWILVSFVSRLIVAERTRLSEEDIVVYSTMEWDRSGRWWWHHCPVDHQCLIFTVRQLQDDKTLAQYKIQPESLLHMLLRICGGGTKKGRTFTTLRRKSVRRRKRCLRF